MGTRKISRHSSEITTLALDGKMPRTVQIGDWVRDLLTYTVIAINDGKGLIRCRGFGVTSEFKIGELIWENDKWITKFYRELRAHRSTKDLGWRFK